MSPTDDVSLTLNGGKVNVSKAPYNNKKLVGLN